VKVSFFVAKIVCKQRNSKEENDFVEMILDWQVFEKTKKMYG
jgi:hypothetical protein